MAPHAIAGGNHSSSASIPESTKSVSMRSSPFGSSADPHVLQNSVYTSAQTLISQAVYSLADTIFSYETVGATNLVDADLQSWAQHFKRQNAVGTVPLFHRLQPRSGAANTILGFAGNSSNGLDGSPLTAVLGANAFAYMQPTLASANKVPLSLNISAVDFDSRSQSLVSNYSGVIATSKTLNCPVVSPVAITAAELQYSVVLNHYLAELTASPSVHLFDGPEFTHTFQEFESVLPVADIGRLYQQLLTVRTAKPASVDQALEIAFANLNAAAGINLAPFEYEGHASPETVFVVHGAHQATQVAGVIKRSSARVGVIKVRVPFPFASARFVATVPASTRKLVVLSPSNSDALKADVNTALYLAGRYGSLTIDEFTFDADFVWSPIVVFKVLSSFVALDESILRSESQIPSQLTANTSPEGSFLVWTRDNSDLVSTAEKLALSLSLDNSKAVSIRSKFDTSVAGGFFQASIVSSDKKSPRASTIVDSADVVLIEDVSILDHFDVLATAKPNATILLVNKKKINNSIEADMVEKLPLDFKRALAKGQFKLTVVDFSIVDELDTVSDSTKGFSADFLAQVAFWRASLPQLGPFIVNKLLQGNGNDFELLASVLDTFVQTVDEKKGLKPVSIFPEWAELATENKDEKKEDEKKEDEKKEDENNEEKEEGKALPFFPKETSFRANPRIEPPSAEDSYHAPASDLATKLVFSEAYGLKSELRPDLPVKNFVVKVQENKRLTPAEYDRNIFHIEFDVTGTGLTYDIGEALGIHARNNSEEVEKFLEFYGVDGDSLVEVSNTNDPSLLEIRSARQALLENVDILGKPPKRFYESLAPYAQDSKEREELERLASPAGAEDLKKRQEVDFSSYVDILEDYKSARPSFSELVKIIAPLKRREYSIASSQKMHPNAVHLLIVVVDWIDSKGRVRYGQCSKYVSDLKIGEELVVSVKPSVMKLPKLPSQPIVMSGLGTGLAPFKAFIEEKVWQQQQGHTIGEIYLYMGSRHKKEEYLYGELWEAYKAQGLLTHIGAAFSRDQPEKIYIQDKIRSSIDDLTDAIVAKNGSFYLCGPTWPVPDITACLEDIVQNAAKREGKVIADVSKVVEDMKEDGRYILEVY